MLKHSICSKISSLALKKYDPFCQWICFIKAHFIVLALNEKLFLKVCHMGKTRLLRMQLHPRVYRCVDFQSVSVYVVI
jgi:hypothetical protein